MPSKRIPALPLLGVLTIGGALFAPPPTTGATLTLNASTDSWLQQDSPNSNSGNDIANDVKSQSAAERRTVIQFGLASVPACATLTNATLRLFVNSNTLATTRTHAAHRLTASWTELGVTWNKRDGVTNWAAAGGDFAAATATATVPGGTGTFVEWNVTADVAAFRAGTATNQGWLVKDASVGTPPDSTVSYASRTNTTVSRRPQLVLTLTGNDAACDDANPCTTNTCDPLIGCQTANVSAGTPCPDDGNPCTTDTCNGSGACTHPAGNAGTECRGVAGPCDVAETCTGTSSACPADAFASTATVCRAATDLCDVAETCTGADASCPADGVAPTTTVCRPAAGACDLAETCTGAGTSCPADAKSTAECRPAAGDCDVAEDCTGTSDDCPADQVASTAVVCRAAAGPCDVSESCNGTGAACPADGFEAASVECRAASDVCDVAEQCTGASATCPADGFEPTTIECRASSGPCDQAELCTGASAACPVDTGQPDGDGDGVCDALDVCPVDADPAQTDTDNDGAGDACDPCTSTAVVAIPKVTVSKLALPSGDEKIRFRGELTLPHPFVPVLEPELKGARVLIERSDGTPVLDALLPPGAFTALTQAGWHTSSTSFIYKNTGAVTPPIGGIVKMVIRDLSTRTPGLLKFSVTGKGATYTVESATLPLRATFVLDPDGQCGTAVFPGPPPVPVCSLATTVLKCR